MANSHKRELDQKIARAERVMWGSAFAWAISVVLLMVIAPLTGAASPNPPLWVATPFLFMFVPVVAAVRLQFLKNERERGIRFGFPQFALFSDRKIWRCNDRLVLIGLSGTSIFWCLLIVAISFPGWLIGILHVATLDLNAIMMLICTTPFVAVGLGGPAFLWRSRFDKELETLTIWNWLQKREFPLTQVAAVEIEYKTASHSVTTGYTNEISGASSSEDRAGHGPLWWIYVAIDDNVDRFKIHVATVESRRQSAQRMADVIAAICNCPILDLQAGDSECSR